MYKIGDKVVLNDHAGTVIFKHEAKRVHDQKRIGKITTIYGTLLPEKDRSFRVLFPACKPRQKDIVLHDVSVNYIKPAF